MKNIKPEHFVFAGAGLAIISNFLPWASAKVTMGGQVLTEVSVNGWNRDGAIIFLFAAAAVVLTVLKQPGKEKLFAMIALICAGLALLIGVYDLISAGSSLSSANQNAVPGVEASVSLGIGLYLVVVAAVVLGWGCLQRWLAAPNPPAGGPPPPTPPLPPSTPPPMPPPQA